MCAHLGDELEILNGTWAKMCVHLRVSFENKE